MTTLRRPLLAAAFAVLAGTAFAQQTLPPLRTGVDGTFAPHAMPKLGGGVEGFQIDLFNEVARRMHRDIVIESAEFQRSRSRPCSPAATISSPHPPR